MIHLIVSSRCFLFVSVLVLIVPLAIADEIPTKSIEYVVTLGEDGELSLPTDVVVDEAGFIYVVDSGNDRIAIFNKEGEYLRSFGETGELPGQFQGPIGIAIDANERLFIADKGNNRVQIFNLSGKVIKTFKTIFQMQEVSPIDVAIGNKSEQIFVTGNANHQVMAYDQYGNLSHYWGGEGANKGMFRYPATLAVSQDNKLYVVDVLNTRVQVFESNGEYVLDVGSWGVLPGQFFRPKGVAIDDSGLIYVSDSYMGVIQIFDNHHRFSHVLGDNGVPTIFSTPSGVFVDKLQRLYVAEMLDNKVSVYQLR
ncbi:MAG: NHL repeat-containing protein [Gammaproteobacteria bacterium]|nr:NHL repeat-containing protein [Gammaproteobacteria bacterium]